MTMNLIKKLELHRNKTAQSIQDFCFNKKRVKVLTKLEDVKENAKCIIYWMCRDCRVQDNWSLLFAQRLATKYNVSIEIVAFVQHSELYPTVRQFNFYIDGLKDIQLECKRLNIGFHAIEGNPTEEIPKLAKDNDAGAVICEFFPIKPVNKWQEALKEILSDIPLVQVDSHNVVPTWIASEKLEYSAATIRRKINALKDDYLTSFPPIVKHKWTHKFVTTNAASNLRSVTTVENEAAIDDWAKAGYKAGIEMLESFCNSRLKDYNSQRNDPTKECLSNLSPWLHFGHVSAQRCILVASEFSRTCKPSVDSFIEEVLIRRELSDNYCFYNPHYGTIQGAHGWAQETLKKHKNDKRDYLYAKDEFENAKTHDALWNAAQLQLTSQGKLHGYMRMYWAKKILEWTESPEIALEIALYMNDRYSLDGTDPNGYVGVMWSICGVHDQGWKERSVFGKIRYMNFAGCKRKFNVDEYINKWGGMSHVYKPSKKYTTK